MQDESEEDEKQLTILIHQAGNVASIRRKKCWTSISKN